MTLDEMTEAIKLLYTQTINGYHLTGRDLKKIDQAISDIQTIREAVQS